MEDLQQSVIWIKMTLAMVSEWLNTKFSIGKNYPYVIQILQYTLAGVNYLN